MRTPGSLALALGAILLVAGSAHALLWWTSTSSLTTSARSPPVVFELGDASGNRRYVKDIALTQDRTAFVGTLKGRSGADVSIPDVVRLVGASTEPTHVSFTAPRVADPNVIAFTWTVRNGTTPIGTLDLKAASPTLSFTLPASAAYHWDARMRLADAAGPQNTDASFSIKSVIG